METRRATARKCTAIHVLACVLTLAAGFGAFGQQWYAGKWDSSGTGWSNQLDSHPRTVVVRAEILDRDSHTPIPGVEVRLEGLSREEVFRESEIPYFPGMGTVHAVDREFRLTAWTDDNGIAVFALRWLKVEPNNRFLPPDDVERVQQISARKEGYKYAQGALYFGTAEGYLANPEMDPASLWVQWPLTANGWPEWRAKVRHMTNARYFQLDIRGSSFSDFPNEACTDPILFEKVRTEQYDFDWPNLSNMSNTPPERIGPFLVVPVRGLMQKIYAEQPIRLERPVGRAPERPHEQTAQPRENPAERQRMADEQREREEEAERQRQQEAQQRQRDQEAGRRQQLEAERQQLAKANILGIAVETYTYDRYGEIGYPYGTPPEMAVITAVDPSSPAAKAGLQAGDVIMQLGSKGISNKNDFDKAVSYLGFEDQIMVSYMRNLHHDQTMVSTRARPAPAESSHESSPNTSTIPPISSSANMQETIDSIGGQLQGIASGIEGFARLGAAILGLPNR